MTTLQDIEARAKKLQEARARVTAIVTELNKAIDLLKRSELPKLRKAIAAAAEHHDALKALIADAPDLFEKPKTRIFHGYKVGYRKAKGKLVYTDAERVCRLIKKHFPDQVKTLIDVKETPVKAALDKLPAAELKKLDITVTDTGDVVVCDPVESDTDKLVEALLSDATEEVAP